VPSLLLRARELPRIIDEYGHEAAKSLGVDEMCFTSADRQWVAENAATTLPDIERATMRLVALKTSANLSQAAARLGMTPDSLSRWVFRRKALPTLPEL
jgi:DNA-binding transcriptional regulator YdaS (Cro superfamily)